MGRPQSAENAIEPATDRALSPGMRYRDPH
jgi:hypothetical protein